MSEVFHILVTGRVQGVGFRFFAQQAANRYGVAGWVRNLPSGKVEILARMPGGEQSPFLEALRSGPPLAGVTEVRVHAAGDDRHCPETGFAVR